MKMDFAVPAPLEYFETLVRTNEPRLLFEAAISIGQDAEPHLDVEKPLYQFDRMLKLLRECVPWAATSSLRLTILNQFFYTDLGFAGNHNDFYNPENSYLHRVLETRRGIPISLAVLWLELAHGIGLQAHGVSFPGHFLVKVNLPEGVVVQDPLTGRALSHEQLGEWLEPYREAWGVDADDMAPLELFLQPCAHREILARMLRNLKSIHQQHEDHEAALAVLNRLITLMPTDWSEYRDRGLEHLASGERRFAIRDLQTYAKHAETAPDLEMVQAQLAMLRSA